MLIEVATGITSMLLGIWGGLFPSSDHGVLMVVRPATFFATSGSARASSEISPRGSSQPSSLSFRTYQQGIELRSLEAWHSAYGYLR
jgi:hypothetical protein